MWYFLYFAIVASTLAGVIHDFEDHHAHHHEPIEHDTDHHHKVEHQHAESHQSFKIHHYHAVPVYVKKEDKHFLKHPIEVGGVDHKLKLVHPETKEHHGHGLVLENHTDEHSNHHHSEHGEHQEHHSFEPHQHEEHHEGGGGGSGGEHHQFHDINVHHGHH